MSKALATKRLLPLVIGLVVFASGVSIIIECLIPQRFRPMLVVSIMIGAVFVCYSLILKDWCASPNAFSIAFHLQSFESCLLQKGWLAF